MARFRAPSLRLAVGLTVAILGLLETQGLLQTMKSQTRLRDRMVRMVRDGFLAARPRLGEALLPGGTEAWTRAADEALAASLGAEVEVFDGAGRSRFSRPRPCPVEHWPGRDEVQAIQNGSVLVVGPVTNKYTRLLSYASFRSGDETVVLRVSTAVPELLDDLRERRLLLLGHGVALLVLAVAAALVLSPWPDPWSPAPQALDAYEEAMERLRARGEQLSREHDAERHRMEEALREREAMARAGELTAGVAHEVRNGLGTIVGYARLLEHAGMPDEAAAAARGIREECGVLETVVRRFMEFVKQETLHLAPFELGRLLSRVAARESRGRPGADVLLTPGVAASLVGDEELLERAFENLVRNAREAAGPEGHVTIGCRREADVVAVAISDDGPGLPPDSPRSPRPFFTTKPGGLGLGLPLALKIVRLHAGDLELANRTPGGLTATVRLPADGPRSDDGATSGSTP